MCLGCANISAVKIPNRYRTVGRTTLSYPNNYGVLFDHVSAGRPYDTRQRFRFVRSALLLAVVLLFEATPGLCCFLRVTLGTDMFVIAGRRCSREECLLFSLPKEELGPMGCACAVRGRTTV